MLILKDENGNMFRATETRHPNLNSRSKWYSAKKYINNETITFHYVRGNGSSFYFQYNNKWHRLLMHSIFIEDKPTKYTITI